MESINIWMVKHQENGKYILKCELNSLSCTGNIKFMKRILEIRKCINCGKEFVVNTNVVKSSSKKQMFCQDCCSHLSSWEKRVIKMNTFPEQRQMYLEQKRQEFLRDYKII